MLIMFHCRLAKRRVLGCSTVSAEDNRRGASKGRVRTRDQDQSGRSAHQPQHHVGVWSSSSLFPHRHLQRGLLSWWAVWDVIIGKTSVCQISQYLTVSIPTWDLLESTIQTIFRWTYQGAALLQTASCIIRAPQRKVVTFRFHEHLVALEQVRFSKAALFSSLTVFCASVGEIDHVAAVVVSVGDFSHLCELRLLSLDSGRTCWM